jgi:hypothetical protein
MSPSRQRRSISLGFALPRVNSVNTLNVMAERLQRVLFRAMNHCYETAGHLGNSRRTRDALTILPRLEQAALGAAEPRLVIARLQFELRNRRVLRGSRSNRMSEVTSNSKCAAEDVLYLSDERTWRDVREFFRKDVWGSLRFHRYDIGPRTHG